jgi:hypothetical protein
VVAPSFEGLALWGAEAGLGTCMPNQIWSKPLLATLSAIYI